MISCWMGLTGVKKVLLAGIVAATAGAVLIVPAQLQADSSAGASATKRVSVRDDFFSPRRVSLAVGDRVRWTWRGDNEHNVRFRRAPRGASKRGAGFRTRGSFSRSFSKRGTYRYVCTLHEDAGMRGTVVAR
jgi:plastocyanin